MRITLIFTGNTKVSYIAEGTNDYIQRLGHYVPLRIIKTRDLKTTRKRSPEDIKTAEGKLILQHIKPSDHIILLDAHGKKFSSEQFAKKLNSLEGRTGNCVFIVGGAYGFSKDVYSAASEKISLSDMTFSHQMVRMILAEQLYR
ncbi:MAG TPA: 23S rRNA (pseudouridine(1915)-N(3))-methyltransferase RlmH, partial [Bacteroidales bacterium]|nr:23S rRNA (pseudouridine(1915)-N(3))-methyltransferase RlmH [Bacteroidales bacterium]